MKLRIWLSLGIVGLLCNCLSAEPLMITHLKGKVENVHDQPLKLLTKMYTGQTINLADGAVVTLTSLHDGTRYTITGQSKAEVARRGVMMPKGQESKLETHEGRAVTDEKPKNISSSMGGTLLRSNFDKPIILSVGNLSEPILHWQEFRKALRYEVTISRKGKVVQRIETEGLSAPLSLRPSLSYEVKLTAIELSSPSALTNAVPKEHVSETTTTVKLLRTAPKSLLSLVKDHESELYLNPQDSTDIVIVFSQLFERELYYDALQLLNNATDHEKEFSELRAHLMMAIYGAQKGVVGSKGS